MKLLSSQSLIDIIQIEQQPLALIAPILRTLKSAPIIIDDFMFMSTYNRGFLWLLSYFLDLTALKTASIISTASQHALDYLKRAGLNNVYAPNGIEIPEQSVIPKSNPDSVFVGTLGFSQNFTAVHHLIEIMTKLRDSTIITDVVVIGGPESIAQSFRSIAKEKGLDLRFTGRVSDETLGNYLKLRAIGLLPFFSDTPTIGGQRVKALEYFANGLVVISGSEGLRGIDGVVNGKNCVIAQDLEKFSHIFKEIIDCWGDYKKIGLEARKLAMEHSWEKSLKKWEEVLNRTCHQRSTTKK